MLLRVTNKALAEVLDLTTRTVQNKRSGYTDWTLPEYQLLVKHYGQDVADEIVKGVLEVNDTSDTK